MKKLLFAIILVILATFSAISIAHAGNISVPLQIPISGEKSITVCVGEFCGGIAKYISLIYEWLVGFAAILAVLAMTWGGVQWLISRGESGKIQEARKVIGNAVIGLTLALSSYLILTTINPKLVTFNPLRIKQISPLALEINEVKNAVFSSGGGLHKVASMTSNPTTWDSLLQAKSAAAGVDCTLVKAIMLQESSGNPSDVSPKGAVGLMQVMSRETGPDFSGRPSKSELLNTGTNVEWGIKILKENVSTACNNRSSGDGCDVTPLGGSIASIDSARISSDSSYKRALELLFAAYNAGPGTNKPSSDPKCAGKLVWECESYKDYSETRAYVPRIFENFQELKKKGWGCGVTTSSASASSSTASGSTAIALASAEENVPPPFSTENPGIVESELIACGDQEDESAENRSLFNLFTPAYAAPKPAAYTCPVPRIKLFNQRNYKDVSYGGCGTIAEAGCAPTSTAMVLNHYGKTVNPESVAKAFADSVFR